MKKVLAVIPARAGSKGIPNKNVRLLNEKPLICYALETALASKRITDIVVTTDSDRVAMHCKKYGVRVHRRDPALARDDTTLDAVIYDAAKDVECDIVVTMQPTSPTLRVETLDSAIAQLIDQGLDTLISVVNRRHLTWRREGERVVPNYKERLNRQYLPDNYYETGAFLIARKEWVTGQSRIGPKVSVYETSEDEAVDIDSYVDLITVGAILNQQRIAIYVNGNNARGMGHIYRALEIADMFYVKPDIYYDINQTDPRAFGQTTHNLKGVNGLEELLGTLRRRQYTLLISDILDTTVDYMLSLRQALPGAKLVNFEDGGEGAEYADLVINAFFGECDQPHIYCGEKYYIPPSAFLLYDPIAIAERVGRVFISFGGADPQNYTDRVLRIVEGERYRGLHFTVVLGRAKANSEELLAYNSRPHIEVFRDVENMPEIMSGCDIGITSRGRTGFELAMLGIPSIAMAQNQRESVHGFITPENGFLYLGVDPADGEIEAALDRLIASGPEERLRLQQAMLRSDLRGGRRRVLGLMDSI